VQVLAVDWSGKRERAEESIWSAAVRDGMLVSLENGRDREATIAHVVRVAEAAPRTVLGLDFAFSFPRWWCEMRGWRDVREVWAAVSDEEEQLLQTCAYPFWGRAGRPNPHPGERGYRRTERHPDRTAKSVFQLGGAGAVGTGSIRGMVRLAELAERDLSIWPFTAMGWPRVVEIYPRALLTRRVNKSRWAERIEYLQDEFWQQDPALLERAAGSEDAFDAAVSALVMAEHHAQLAALTPTGDPDSLIEGEIWRPR
jgi:predicted nuclease with RNAse H fold